MSSKLGVILKETATSQYTSATGEGFLYVKNGTPNTLQYVDDSGTDNQVSFTTVYASPDRLVFQFNQLANQNIGGGSTLSSFNDTTIVENVGGYFSSPATNLQMTIPIDQIWLFTFALDTATGSNNGTFKILRSGGTISNIERPWHNPGENSGISQGISVTYVDYITAGGPYTISIHNNSTVNFTVGGVVLTAVRLA